MALLMKRYPHLLSAGRVTARQLPRAVCTVGGVKIINDE
jgi:hypothetical protein